LDKINNTIKYNFRAYKNVSLYENNFYVYSNNVLSFINIMHVSHFYCNLNAKLTRIKVLFFSNKNKTFFIYTV